MHSSSLHHQQSAAVSSKSSFPTPDVSHLENFQLYSATTRKMTSKNDNKASPKTKANNTPDDGEQELFVSILGGLAGSSCCILQLLLNFLFEMRVIHPFGCAGFNKILGPLRVYLRAATFLYFVYKFSYDKKCCSKQRLIFYFLVCTSLMFMPEILRLSRMASAIAPSTTNAEKLVFTVNNMGCEACETHVKRIVESFDGVIQVESIEYETGLMHVSVNRDWNFDENKLDATLESKGYDLLPAGSVTKKMEMDVQWETGASFGDILKEDL